MRGDTNNKGNYDRLRKMGEERFLKIKNDLLTNVPAQRLARRIQGEWKEFEGVSESTLTQQLNRLKHSLIREAGASKELAQAVVENGVKINMKEMVGTKIDVYQEMEVLAVTQRTRIQRLVNKEADMPVPLAALNPVIVDYRQTLLDMQKMRFELGLDIYRGPLGSNSTKIATEIRSNADGSQTSRTLIDAVNVTEAILDKHRVSPTVVEGK